MRPQRMVRKVRRGYRKGQRMVAKARREAIRPRRAPYYRPRSRRRGCLLFLFI